MSGEVPDAQLFYGDGTPNTAAIGEPFDVEAGKRLKEAGMSAADAHAQEEWKAAFDRHVDYLDGIGRAWTSEDVVRVVGMPPSGSGNAVGARTRANVRRLGHVEVGTRLSERPTSHAARLVVWQRPPR